MTYFMTVFCKIRICQVFKLSEAISRREATKPGLINSIVMSLQEVSNYIAIEVLIHKDIKHLNMKNCSISANK